MKITGYCLILLFVGSAIQAQIANAPDESVANIPVSYTEAKAGQYTLPNVLTLADGTPVRNVDVQMPWLWPVPMNRDYAGALTYIHKVKSGRDIYFFANSTDAAVDATVVLRAAPPEPEHLALWDPHTGQKKKADAHGLGDRRPARDDHPPDSPAADVCVLRTGVAVNTKLLPILAFLWLVGGHALAQVNLLPQGSFERPDVNTGWAEGFNIPNNQEFQVISEDGKHWLRIENRDAGRQLDYVHAYVKVTPQIASLTISVRLKATNLKVGKEGWHAARVALSVRRRLLRLPSGSARTAGGLRLGDEVGGVEGARGGDASEHPAGHVPLHRRVRDRRPHGHAPPGRRPTPVGGRRAAGRHQPWTGTRRAS